MIKKLYSVYDKVPAVFNNPFVAINDSDAIRMFDQACNENPHGADYELYFLGTMDDNSAEIKSTGCNRIRTGLESRATAADELTAAQEGK